MLTEPIDLSPLLAKTTVEKTYYSERAYYVARLQNEEYYLAKGFGNAEYAEHTKQMIAMCDKMIGAGRGYENAFGGSAAF